MNESVFSANNNNEELTIAVVCLWLKNRIGGKLSEDEIQTGAFSEALRLAINELQSDSNCKQEHYNELNNIDKEILNYDGKTCTEIGINKCIDLFKRYNVIYGEVMKK